MSDHQRQRIRDLGIELPGFTGDLNSITDVPGLEVGHCTLIEGDSIRTGVTVIHPRGKNDGRPVYAGWFSLNGNGELTGTAWIDEAGLISGPIGFSNTNAVGTVRGAIVKWELSRNRQRSWYLPVVGETWDGVLNDINGFNVQEGHVLDALESAGTGLVAEGNVGGGTGMICHGYKGGIGCASRKVLDGVVGVLVQANHGSASQLRILGRPLASAEPEIERGSIIVVLATDLPMLPHQLKALAKRGALGMARNGAVASIWSGDLMLAFSTANPIDDIDQRHSITALGLAECSQVYEAAVQATEEAILNALCKAETMSGFNGSHIEELPYERIRVGGG